MAYKLYTSKWYSTTCHVLEFNPKEYRFDVSLGIKNKLEPLSRIDGEHGSDERTLAKMNGSFFAMNGKGGDIYSTYVDEGKYYHKSTPYFPTLIFWKDYTLTVEKDPTQNRIAEYQSQAFFAIGCAWTLILNGEINFTYDKAELVREFGHPYQRNPRTFLGQKPDGTIVWVVTDGRGSGSLGLTITQQAEIMKSLGCNIAVNMDGGGSSELIVNNKIINRLQNGYERNIGSAFLVYEKVATTSKDKSNTPSTYKTTIANLNMRIGRGTQFGIICTIPEATEVEVYDDIGGWCAVRYGTKKGYCSNSYLT